jgi:hypothetical protein
MTKKLKFIGAALVALAILPAAVLLFHLSFGTVFSLALGIGGYTLLGYESFQIDGNFGGGYTGGTTPPTQAQSITVGTVVAQLTVTDTDTTFTLTHNFNLTAAQVTALRPLVLITISGGVGAVGTAVAPVYTVTVGANTVTLTKLQATGSGSTIVVAMFKPGPGYGF